MCSSCCCRFAPSNLRSSFSSSQITALGKACELKKPEWVKAMVDLGADVNMLLTGSADSGDTAVMICARGNDNATMEALLTANNRNPGDHRMRVNPNYTKEAENALSLAVMNDNGVIAKMLLEHGASPYKPCGYMGLMDWGERIEGGDETNPFFLACATGKVNAVKEIVKCMAFHAKKARDAGRSVGTSYNIDRQSEEGDVTGLMMAAYGGHVQCVRYMCKEGSCNVTLKDRLGRTAAHFASMQGHEDVVLELCGVFGASASVKDSTGKNVEMYAKNDKTRYAARMAIAGDEGYVTAVNEAVDDARGKVRDAEAKLERAMEDLRRAQEIVGEVDANDGEITVAQRYKALGEMISSESGLRSTTVVNLVDIKQSLAEVTGKVEKEVRWGGGGSAATRDLRRFVVVTATDPFRSFFPSLTFHSLETG